MKKFSLLALLLVLTACPKVCNLAETTAQSLTPALASKWGCTNEAQMNTDIQAALSNSFLCSGQALPTGMLGDLVCPLLSNFLRTQLASKVPVSWGCNPSLIGADAAAGLTAVCEAVFPL